jgi:hypothetical protein
LVPVIFNDVSAAFVLSPSSSSDFDLSSVIGIISVSKEGSRWRRRKSGGKTPRSTERERKIVKRREI